MSYSSRITLGLLAGAFSGFTNAQDVPPGVVIFNAAKAQWTTSAGAGNPQAKIIGDDQKPGPYVFITRARPIGVNSPAARPHTHPDDRTYTVISGTWYVGFGDKFDESKLIPLTAGSFYTEPAGVPHFIMVKDEGTVVKITGTGPSKLVPVQAK
jgi:mannose-6-phosphate isomerase-like protein (cupin superfamily)